MSQIVYAVISGKFKILNLPNSNERLIGNIYWGRFDEVFSPAFWAMQVWFVSEMRKPWLHRIGSTLKEEVAACLLGGYGIRSEVGLAVFQDLRSKGMFQGAPSEGDFFNALNRHFTVGGKPVRYRFPQQRSRYLAYALRRLSKEDAPTYDDLKFREWLLTFPGIGLKTASWITRNWLDSDRVAILDVHVHRAGVLAGIFHLYESPSNCYLSLEKKLVEFAKALSVRLSLLDAVIWDQMRQMQGFALEILRNSMTNLNIEGGKSYEWRR